MKRILLLVCLCVPAWNACAQSATNSQPVTNEGVIEMFEGGLSADSILLYIEGNETRFDTSPQALVELKEAGLPDSVINTMIRAGRDQIDPASLGSANWIDASDADVLPPPVTVVRGGQYYTRFTIYSEDGSYYTTNYRRFDHLPINSFVEVRRLGSSRMELNVVESGERITIENVPQYSKRTMQEFADLMLSGEPTKIELYGEEMADLIRKGELRLGMTKTQVLLARGYPPAHRTDSTDLDRWVFWSSRFINRTLVFADGRLIEGRDIE